MIAEYTESRADENTLKSEEPMDYLVSGVDHWLEISQYVMEILDCPAASFLYERSFNATQGFIKGDEPAYPLTVWTNSLL